MLKQLRTPGEMPLSEFDRVCVECVQALEVLFGPTLWCNCGNSSRS